MIREKLLETIDIRAEQTGISDRALSVQATGSTDTVRNIRRGAYPRIDTVEALFEVLEMRIEITEKPISNAQYVLSGITRVGVMAMAEMQTRSGRERLENLNKNKFNSENTALAVPPEIVFALNLPEGASPDDVVLAIQALLSDQTNERWTVLETEIKALREAIQKLTPDNHIAEPSVLYETTDKDDVASARPVSVMELAAAAGGGALELDERVVGQVWFRRDWLDRKSIDSTQCNIISVKGESMEPTLPDDSKILVARHRCRRRVGGIFVINTEEGLIVKRLGKDNNGDWQLISDNSSSDWPTLPWQRDMTVIGEVMWVARSL